MRPEDVPKEEVDLLAHEGAPRARARSFVAPPVSNG
jgi:hypothetical protein